MIYEYGAASGMKIGRGNGSTQRKTCPSSSQLSYSNAASELGY
jgi:hypothetical protein